MRATRKGDENTGHDFCPPRKLVEGSNDVFINGRNAGRTGDSYEPHECGIHRPHVGYIASGSDSVYINRRGAGREGDAVSCGGTAAESSPDVYIG